MLGGRWQFCLLSTTQIWGHFFFFPSSDPILPWDTDPRVDSVMTRSQRNKNKKESPNLLHEEAGSHPPVLPPQPRRPVQPLLSSTSFASRVYSPPCLLLLTHSAQLSRIPGTPPLVHKNLPLESTWGIKPRSCPQRAGLGNEEYQQGTARWCTGAPCKGVC